ncbi:hypothetical protein CSUI_007066 [Cystoisospora suis]|uniref:Uncharacterized protein n=1 Tax=Cystoisospora suis TaxID=483139 RepID=A0A2C6JWZ8_9APIC|nr:hypothetical protein CSUI_007066 [Cystoisospora suis]
MKREKKKTVAGLLCKVPQEHRERSEALAGNKKGSVLLSHYTTKEIKTKPPDRVGMLPRPGQDKGSGSKQKHEQRREPRHLTSLLSDKKTSGGSGRKHSDIQKNATKGVFTDGSDSVPRTSGEEGEAQTETGRLVKRKRKERKIQQSLNEDNNHVTKDEVEKETRRSCRQEVDDLFADCAKAMKSERARDDTSLAPSSAPVKKVQKKKRHRPASFEEDLGLNLQVARFTEDGLRIYSEEELKIGQGGGTPSCPFDCNCCF